MSLSVSPPSLPSTATGLRAVMCTAFAEVRVTEDVSHLRVPAVVNGPPESTEFFCLGTASTAELPAEHPCALCKYRSCLPGVI